MIADRRWYIRLLSAYIVGVLLGLFVTLFILGQFIIPLSFWSNGSFLLCVLSFMLISLFWIVPLAYALDNQ